MGWSGISRKFGKAAHGLGKVFSLLLDRRRRVAQLEGLGPLPFSLGLSGRLVVRGERLVDAPGAILVHGHALEAVEALSFGCFGQRPATSTSARRVQ